MPISDYTPSLDQVGALERDRTVDAGGNEVGTFTTATRPTAAEATLLINQAAYDASLLFGQNIPDAGLEPGPNIDPEALRNAAKDAVAYHAAALIEIGHFGEQVAQGNSPYQEYEALWQAEAIRIQEAISNLGGEIPVPIDTTKGTMKAQFDFPEDAGGMVGWGTRW